MDSFDHLQPTPVMSNSGGTPNRPPGENDVIVGSGCNKHSGNLKFQQFIKAYKRARFRTNPKIETADAVKEVVEFWRRLSPRGRFLAQNKHSNDGQWHEVDDKQAMRIASFSLLNQKSVELKRQKSIDAMRGRRASQNGPPLLRSQSGPVPQSRRLCSGFGSDLLLTGIGEQDQSPMDAMVRLSNHGQEQIPDMTESLEPMPIGPTRSSSMASMAWDKGRKQQRQQRLPLAQRKSFQEPVKSSSRDLDLDAFDFNPLPFEPIKDPVDDFEPIQTNFNSNNCFISGKNSVDVSSNAQFGGSPDQVQVSVNMVVNTKPQGFPRENAVNTVTNIQIGTGTMNDESQQGNTPSHNGDGYPGQNFQLTTDTSNGFIQISTQSNSLGIDDHSMMSSGSAQGGSIGFQSDAGKILGQGNCHEFHDGNFISGNSGMIGNKGIELMNEKGTMTGAANMMNGNTNMINGNMPERGIMVTGSLGNGKMDNGMKMNENLMGNNTAGQKMNVNVSVNASSPAANNSDAGVQNHLLRWNKNEVANSVPCAASLVGSLFDDW